MKLATLALLSAWLAVPSLAAADWQVGPNAAWAGDATVSVTHYFTDGTPAGARIGADKLMIGPLLPGELRPIADAAFVDGGKTVCANAYAVRGPVQSQVVSACKSFQLGAPSLFLGP